jgi:hypothetical protein
MDEDPYAEAMTKFQNAVRSAFEAGLDTDFMVETVDEIGDEYDSVGAEVLTADFQKSGKEMPKRKKKE